MLLDLVGGKVLCNHCGEWVKPIYRYLCSSICVCSICLRNIRDSEARRKYEQGFKWCSRCGTFRQSWDKKTGVSLCCECHCKLRSRSYTKHAKQQRELTIKRY